MQIIELLERAEEGSQDLDVMVAQLLGHKIGWSQARYTGEQFAVIDWQKPHPYAGMREPCPKFTSSMDDILCLVNQMFPAFELEFRYIGGMKKNIGGMKKTHVKLTLAPTSKSHSASAHYPAQAVSLALMKAIHASPGE